VKNGGHVVMTFKSGFANENSAVRWVRAPGPLREAAGFSYQEFSNLEHPLALKGRSLPRGRRKRQQVSYWAEFLMPEHAKAIAFYDHPFFGKWPAITKTSSAPARCSTREPISPTSCKPRCSKAC
jgi:beta-galactosidase